MGVRKLATVFFLLSLFSSSLAASCYNCTFADNFICKSNPDALEKNTNNCEGQMCLSTTEKRWCASFAEFSEIAATEPIFCNTDYCNNQSYEFDCIACDSANDSNCKANSTLVTQTCKSKTMCYSNVDSSGLLTRGCTACMADDLSCHRCNDDEKCNTATHQKCYQCNSTDPNCLEVTSTTTTNQCPPNNICYSKLTNDGFIERGCSAETCDNSSCVTCIDDNCNNQILPSNRLSCLQCNGTTDCNQGTALAKYCTKYSEGDKCFAYAEGTQMIRGCLSDIEGNCSDCEFCNSTNCNTWKFEERPSNLKCFQCETNCHEINETQTSAISCKSYPFNAEEKCYTLTENNTVKRGCFHDDANISSKCTNETLCSTCSSDGCNKESVISCYDCVDCLNTTPTTPTKQCPIGNVCFSKLNGSSVIRGCTEDNSSLEEENYETCDEDKCNGGTFPKDRVSCYQCISSSETDDCAKGSNTFLKECPIYKKNDKCYLFADENNIIHRGCLTDIDVNLNMCTEKNHCEECSKAGCNSKPLYSNATLSCVQCSNCTNKLPTETLCNSSHLYYLKDECYTETVTQGNLTVTNRGCILDFENQDSCSNCTRCLVDGCNKYGDDYEEFPDFKCVVCHGVGDNCAKKPPQRCEPIPTSLNEGIGCFVERKGDLVIRDCLTNIGLWNTTITSSKVRACKTDSCNTMAAPSSAVATQLSTVLLITLIALLFSFK